MKVRLVVFLALLVCNCSSQQDRCSSWPNVLDTKDIFLKRPVVWIAAGGRDGSSLLSVLVAKLYDSFGNVNLLYEPLHFEVFGHCLTSSEVIRPYLKAIIGCEVFNDDFLMRRVLRFSCGSQSVSKVPNPLCRVFMPVSGSNANVDHTKLCAQQYCNAVPLVLKTIRISRWSSVPNEFYGDSRISPFLIVLSRDPRSMIASRVKLGQRGGVRKSSYTCRSFHSVQTRATMLSVNITAYNLCKSIEERREMVTLAKDARLPVLEVHYEQLASKPHEIMHEIADFLGISHRVSWDELNPYMDTFFHAERTTQVNQPFSLTRNATAVLQEDWKDVLTNRRHHDLVHHHCMHLYNTTTT